jgi:hypothetical protein
VQLDDIKLATFAPSSKIVLGDLDGTGPKFKVLLPCGREKLVVLAGRA